MNNRYEIAHEFADAIRTDDIIKIILFGSVARGDDTEESDIDILIVTVNSDELTDEIIRQETIHIPSESTTPTIPLILPWT